MKMKHIMLATTAVMGLAGTVQAENVLRWGAHRDIGSLDPYSYGDSFTINVLNHVYEGLVRYDRDLKIEPALAASWEILEDQVTWRFKLREGVTFHNGNPFTAADVVASLTRVSDETSPLKGNLPAYVSSTVVDDYTVDITLNGTYPLLLNDLTNIHIFDEEWMTENDALMPTDIGAGTEGFATYNANGTGPFIVESRQPDAKTVFVVNPDWWDEARHNLDRIELTPVNSAATRVAALLSGEINFTNEAPVQDLPRLEAAPNVELLEGVDLRTVMIGFPFRETLTTGESNPFSDIKVREALYKAIDLDLIHQKVMRGKSRIAGATVAPPIPGYVETLDDVPDFDPDSAKALLAEAGVPEGLEFEFNCLSDGLVNEEQFCQAIASMWSRIGLAPKLDVAPRAVQSPKRTNGSTDVYTLGWATLPMLDSYSPLLQIFHSKDGNAGVFNWGGWSYPELDALIDAAGSELDFDKRMALQTEALQLVKDEIIMIPLHQQPMAWAVTDEVTEMPLFPDAKPRLWFVNVNPAS
ncbi:ABC transporter substrate-binding protein [Qingshengfaniella alkalisoli]|uniref:ABC transporter substrate-binding protein n=1 Tax=Qingshengfaniella alkalisoli TaxID=2599296 RepID=A0A5B8J389_9RHOB|nr:ABC transporter substrate-binding protein [Qingshengfaniella alkalisoli]QDY68957.1 ABC transporter substrate-binding protein [Qingshengfaniella alkalisoli]